MFNNIVKNIINKTLNTLMAVAIMLTYLTLTACGDDEPETPVIEKEIKTANVAVSLYVNQAMAVTYDITATTSSGDVISLSSTPVEVNFRGENVLMYYITSQVTGDKLPMKSVLKLKFMLKDGFSVPEKSDFALSVVANGDATYTDGSTSPSTPNATHSRAKAWRAA